MAVNEHNIWTELGKLSDGFPGNTEDVKMALKSYYGSVGNSSPKRNTTAGQFPKEIVLAKRIKLLAIVVYGDIHYDDIPGSQGIYRDKELSKNILRSPEFWKGISQEDRIKVIIEIFKLALGGEGNSALKAMKDSYEEGKDFDIEGNKFIYFCAAIRKLFLTMLFKDEVAFARQHPLWSQNSKEAQDAILAAVPERILNDSECDQVIAALIPLLYPGKTAEDYYKAVGIPVPRSDTILHNKVLKGDINGVKEELQELKKINEEIKELEKLGIQKKVSHNDAGVNAKGSDNKTPLHLAVQYTRNLDMVKLLLDEGANVNVQDDLGKTPLHYAMERSTDDVARLLISRGADVNVKDRTGKTPLHYAEEKGKVDVAKLLVEKGAQTNIQDSKGKTPADYKLAPKYEEMQSNSLAASQPQAKKETDNELTLFALIIASGSESIVNFGSMIMDGGHAIVKSGSILLDKIKDFSTKKLSFFFDSGSKMQAPINADTQSESLFSFMEQALGQKQK